MKTLDTRSPGSNGKGCNAVRLTEPYVPAVLAVYCYSYPIHRSVFRIPYGALVILPFKSEDNSETMNLPTTANASTAFFKSMFHFVTAVACAQSDVQNTITGDTRYNLETSTQPAALHMRKMIQPSALWAALSEKIFFLFVF